MGLKQTEKFLHSQGPAAECKTNYKMRKTFINHVSDKRLISKYIRNSHNSRTTTTKKTQFKN